MLQQLQKPQLTLSSPGQIKFSDINLQSGGASSYIVPKRRDMFQSANERTMQGVNPKDIVHQNGSKLIPKNVLIMNPSQSRSITFPQIFMPDQQLYISVKGNFYTIRDTRNKQKFIQRNSLPLAQIVYFNVQKKNELLVIVSVEVYRSGSQCQQQVWHHVDMVMWDLERDHMERRWAVQKGMRTTTTTSTTASNRSSKSMRSMSNISQKKISSHNQLQSTQHLLQQQFKCIQLLDNYKKALIILDTACTNTNTHTNAHTNCNETTIIIDQQQQQQQLNAHKYEILYIDFFHKNSNSKKGLSFNCPPSPSVLASNNDSSLFYSKVIGRVAIERILRSSMVKLINSDYGDIVMLVTSEDLYELEILSKGAGKQYSITLKPLNVPKMLKQNKNTYISNNNIAHLKQSLKQEELIIDARYFPNSLKVLILTTHGRVMVIESQQCIFTESLYELLSPKDILQSYNIQYILFKHLHFLNGLLIVSVQAQRSQQCNLLKKITYQQSILDKLDERKQAMDYISRGIVVAKVQSNALSFSKFIPLPFDLKTYSYIKIHTSQQIDEMLIQTINLKNPSVLELYKCQVLSNRNTFMPFFTQHLLIDKNQKRIKTSSNSLTADDSPVTQSARFTFGKSQKVFYMLKNHKVSCYRIYSQQFTISQQNGIKKVFTTSFFQKPIKLLRNPLTGTVIILFREFIKIFSNIYTGLQLLHTINVKQVRDIAFSRYGESMFLAMNDNTICLLDSYTYRERKVMEFPGEVKEISSPTDYLFCVKSTKDVLSLYIKKSQQKYDKKSGCCSCYQKLYDIKLQNGDVYCVDETLTVVLKKIGIVEIYSHVPQPRPKSDSTDDNQQQRYNLLKDQHEHLVNRKPLGLQKADQPSYLFYSSQFMTLFVGTRFGHIHQYLYPFMTIDDPSPPECYHYQVSNSSIIHIQISGDFESLIIGSEIGEILQLGFQQFLNGLKRNGVHVVSKTQNNVNQNMIKYEFANRSYLMDNLSTINTKVSTSIQESFQQVSLIDEKLKIDIEDILVHIKSSSYNQIQKLFQQKKNKQSQFKSQFDSITNSIKIQQKAISMKLQQMRENNQKIKSEMTQRYEKELLKIYHENDRLNGIMAQKIKEFKMAVLEIQQEMTKMREEQQQLKLAELQKLQQSYNELGIQYQHYSSVANQQLDQNTFDLQLLKSQQITKYQQKLQLEQSTKQANLSNLAKIQKQIQRYKKRSIYFQNIIVQTTNQIQQLSYDVNIYQDKKSTLLKQLSQKQSTIELKQNEIIRQLKKTTQMKTIKNIHQFELQQFEHEILPVSNKILQLQQKVQKMNYQIMVQFNNKVEKNSMIDSTNRRIQQLKCESKSALQNALYARTKVLRFTQALADILANDPFACDIRRRLSHVINTFSNNTTTFTTTTPNYDLQKQKKQSQNLIRKKTMLLKSIQREEKLQEGVIKNKNQYFRFYSDNTNLVKEFNQLFKENKVLAQQKTQLERKLNELKEQLQHHKTPAKRATSLQSIKKVSTIKLTPFQRYQQEQIQLTTLKLREKDTTETRMTRGQSSSTFLKSLIKDVSIASSKYQKNTRVRDRIRTFVNPDLQKQKQIQKQLFQRQKGKSTYIPILKL